MAPVLPVCLPGLRRSTLCWMPVRTVATPGGRIERRQAGAVNRTLPGPASHINILTNDSKATVSVLYWYRNYPSLEHPLSYFWILRPAPELAQTLLTWEANKRSSLGVAKGMLVRTAHSNGAFLLSRRSRQQPTFNSPRLLRTAQCRRRGWFERRRSIRTVRRRGRC